ncbi:hypothetical protein [Paenibacillus sp. NPDC058071]
MTQQKNGAESAQAPAKRGSKAAPGEPGFDKKLDGPNRPST